MKWDDNSPSDVNAGYGAEVYVVPIASGYSVRARIWIGGGHAGGWMHYHLDLGELGKATTWEQAVSTWGEIKWWPTSVTIGPGAGTPAVIQRTQFVKD